MKGPQVTLTDGRYEFRAPNRGALVLADPPEAGWLLEQPARQEAGRPVVAHAPDRRPACDQVVRERGARR